PRRACVLPLGNPRRTPPWPARPSRCHLEHDAAGPRALLLDLGDPYVSNLSGVAHMRPSAWLQVDVVPPVVDPDEAHPTETDWRTDAHRLAQLRIGYPLPVPNPYARYRVAGRDQPVKPGLHAGLVEQVGHREIQPRVIARAAATVDQLPAKRAQHRRR